MSFLDPLGPIGLPIMPSKPVSKKLSELVSKYNDWDHRIAVAVILAESRGRADATHKNSDGSTDYGLMQVNSVHGYDPKCLLDPECNIDKGHEVYLQQGWNAWTTYKTGAYKLFLGRDATVRVGNQSALGATKDAAEAPLDAAKDATKTVGDFIGWVTDASTWARIGKGVMGSAILIIGVGGIALVVANKASKTPAVKAVTSAIP